MAPRARPCQAQPTIANPPRFGGKPIVSAKQPLEEKPYGYALDDTGNVLADGTATYAYERDRLVRRVPLDDPASTFTYAYDHFGNQTTSTLTTGIATYTTSTTYEAAGHTRRVTVPDGTWVEYAYDGLDRQVRRETSAGVVTLFFHDRSGQTITVETDASGTVKNRYVLSSAGEPLAQDPQAGASARGYFVNDPRGNNAQVLDQSKAVKATFGYDPFGKERAALTNQAAGWDSRLRFQMGPRDPKTGAYALGPRMYDPEINRFVGADHYVGAAANLCLQVDPLTGNAYLYAGANPANLIDDGHRPCGRRGWGYRPCWGRKSGGGKKSKSKGGGKSSGGSGGSGGSRGNPVLEAMMGPMPEPGVDCGALYQDVRDAHGAVTSKADALASSWKGRATSERQFIQSQRSLAARIDAYSQSKCSGHNLGTAITYATMAPPIPAGDPLKDVARSLCQPIRSYLGESAGLGTGVASTNAGIYGGFAIGGPPGAFVGGAFGALLGIKLGHSVRNRWTDHTTCEF